MHIITMDDQDFPDHLDALEHSREIGTFERDGKVQVVRANQRLVMVSQAEAPERISIQPARSLDEAEALALRLLEQQLG